MLARQLRIALAMEAALYVVLGLWLFGNDKASGAQILAQILALILALFLGARVLVVAISLVLVLAYRRALPPALRIGAPGFLRMALRESFEMIRFFALVQPFERFWLGADRLRASLERAPLLLIHGYQCNRGSWFWLRGRLEAAGWVVATHNLEPVLADIDQYADGIAQRIDAVLAATGAQQVILIGHSMGGLASRAYLRRYGTGKVQQLITLASPHQGSEWARMAWGTNGRQMRVKSAWLQALATTALPSASVSIYSAHDNLVVPQRECSELPTARNIALPGLGHMSMLTSPAVLAVLQGELRLRGYI